MPLGFYRGTTLAIFTGGDGIIDGTLRLARKNDLHPKHFLSPRPLLRKFHKFLQSTTSETYHCVTN